MQAAAPAYAVCALLSGGKDSCYAMMCAVKAGHRIVCLGNLRPTDAEVDDVDSWMYQTVGHNVLDSVSRAMGGLPLYRRRIAGDARCTTMNYAAQAGDEVEDLYALLVNVKRSHPEVGAVCSGAILSSYQRARVEAVCARLGLVSLAYLWQRDQHELLDEMLGAGLDAVLIKVASLGLTQAHLGKSLRELRPALHALHSKHGVSVCGEGGEYESLTVDCPLFSHRLVLGRVSVLAAGSGAAVLHVHELSLQCKASPAVEAPAAVVHECPDVAPWMQPPGLELAAAAAADVVLRTSQCGPYVSASVTVPRGAYALLARELFAVAQRQQLEPLCVLVQCDDVTQFAPFNAAYAPLISQRRFPPARAVWQPLDADCVRAEALFVQAAGSEPHLRWLHVQSVSLWAPACIGPYSQLVAYAPAEVVWLSGMIPLDPSTMTLQQAPRLEQIALCVRHCSAILQSMGWAPCRDSVVWATLFVVAVQNAANGEEDSRLRQALQELLPRAVVRLVACAALPRAAPVELLCVAASDPSKWTRSTHGDWAIARGPQLGFASSSSTVDWAGPGTLLFTRKHDQHGCELGFVLPAKTNRSAHDDSDSNSDSD